MYNLNFFKDAQKAFGKIAKLTVEGNKVSMINTITGTKHIFIDGSKEILIKDRKLLTKIKQL